jgi:hypothetical protein
VRVGFADAAVNISVYRDVLSAVSPYIRGAFKGPFRETTDRSLSLTDVTEQTFRIFLQQAHTYNNQQSSSATTPPPGILLQESTTKSADETTTVPAELQTADRVQGDPDAELQPGPKTALDEVCDDHKSVDREEAARLYYPNPGWLGAYYSPLVSFMCLYVFADKSPNYETTY